MTEEWEVQGLFTPEYGWEMVTTEDTKPEAQERLKEYRESDPDHQYRLRRVKA